MSAGTAYLRDGRGHPHGPDRQRTYALGWGFCLTTGEDLIAVLPTREHRGIEKLEDCSDRTPVAVVPFKEAFSRRWSSDAHFVCYVIDPYVPDEPFYRLNKASRKEIESKGVKIILRWAAIDWDTGRGQEHVPWTADHWRRFQSLRAVAEAHDPLLFSSAACEYASNKGYRWVYRLSRVLEPDEWEARVRGLVARFRGWGLDVDELADWTRLFRLPRVLRG